MAKQTGAATNGRLMAAEMIGVTASTTRTTLVLPVTLDQNLEIFAVRSGLSKGEVIKRVLTAFLTKEGLQPDKRPKSISVAY